MQDPRPRSERRPLERQRQKDRHAERMATDPEYVERLRGYKKTRRATNSAGMQAERIQNAARMKACRASDPEYRAAQDAKNSAWKAANPERVALMWRRGTENRRARKAAAFVESVDPCILWFRDEGICHICRLPADENDWHVEHVIPLSKGGEHSYANTAVSHPSCNLRKPRK